MTSSASSKRSGGKKVASRRPAKGPSKINLLSGGNPQIAKGDGDAVVQAYIAAMPGWKKGVGRRIDTLVSLHVPDVKKAMRWNSPFYGVEEKGWFLTFHCFTKYIKVAFLRGSKLRPLPPVESKDPNTRSLHISEDGVFDETLFIDWVKQASKIPGDPLF